MHVQSTPHCGYVYLIGNSRFGWFKIGKSRTPKIRVSVLGVLLPFKVELLELWQAANCSALERLLHERYAANRINGEWFHFSHDELKRLRATDGLVRAQCRAIECFSNMEEDVINGRTKTQSEAIQSAMHEEYRRRFEKYVQSSGLESTPENRKTLRKTFNASGVWPSLTKEFGV